MSVLRERNFRREPLRSRRHRGSTRGRPVEQERIACTDRRHECSSDGGSRREGGVTGDRHETVRLLKQPLGNGLRDEPRRRRRVEGDRGAADGLERDQLPDPSMPRDRGLIVVTTIAVISVPSVRNFRLGASQGAMASRRQSEVDVDQPVRQQL